MGRVCLSVCLSVWSGDPSVVVGLFVSRVPECAGERQQQRPEPGVCVRCVVCVVCILP